MLPYARPGHTVALGGEAPVLPHLGLPLDLFVYKRSSRLMNYDREKQSLRRDLDAARLLPFRINLDRFWVQSLTSSRSGRLERDHREDHLVNQTEP